MVLKKEFKMQRYLSALMFTLVVSPYALAAAHEMTIRADKLESTPDKGTSLASGHVVSNIREMEI